jgi:hypothetical protein
MQIECSTPNTSSLYSRDACADGDHNSHALGCGANGENTWALVGKGRSYTPTKMDVGHRIQFRASVRLQPCPIRMLPHMVMSHMVNGRVHKWKQRGTPSDVIPDLRRGAHVPIVHYGVSQGAMATVGRFLVGYKNGCPYMYRIHHMSDYSRKAQPTTPALIACRSHAFHFHVNAKLKCKANLTALQLEGSADCLKAWLLGNICSMSQCEQSHRVQPWNKHLLLLCMG